MAAVSARRAARPAPDLTMQLNLSACLTVQRPDAPCSACATACPEKAITIGERDVAVRAESCSSCGVCAPSCPTGAIAVAGFASAERLECSRVRKPDGRSVPCLGGLTPACLRDALVNGDVTLVDRGWCADCDLSGGKGAPWAQAVETITAEMVALGLPQRVQVAREQMAHWRAAPAPRPATANPTRRALFNRIARGAGGSGRPLTTPDKVQTPGLRRRAEQLARLSGNNVIARALFPAFRVFGPVPELAALVRLCPTTALDLVEGHSSRTLVLDPTACIDCGACVTTGLLVRDPALEGQFCGLETLAAEARATCTQCRARFSPKGTEKTCGACARDTDLAALTHGLMRRKPSQDIPL